MELRKVAYRLREEEKKIEGRALQKWARNASNSLLLKMGVL